MSSIEGVHGQLSNLAQVLDTAKLPQVLVSNYLEKWHFTVAQHHQLTALLGRLNARSVPLPILPETGECHAAKHVLTWLEKRLLALPVNLSIPQPKGCIDRPEQQP